MKNRIISLLLALSMVLPGTLSAAALLSPAPARAAGAATTHYRFEATTQSKYVDGVLKEHWEINHDQLHTNLYYNDKALRPNMLAIFSGTMHLPTGASSGYDSFRMANTAGTRTSTGPVPYGSSQHTDETLHYGLPYEVRNNESIYYKTATESLEITLQGLKPLETTGLGAVNLSMVILQDVSGGGLNIPLDRRLEVRISLDGKNWLPGSAGVRSATLIAGGTRSSTTETNDTQFFRIETDNLLDIEGFNPGDTIQGIKILPEGEDVCSQGSLYIHELLVNTYQTVEDFDRLSPAEEITYTEATDPLRDIAVAEAVRTASVPWTSTAKITIHSPAGSSSGASNVSSRPYFASTAYRGPVYERNSDSSRELFQSLLADDNYNTLEARKVTSELKVGNTTYTYTHPYGMDCQTFVFNAVSRVSRTNAWAASYTLWATRAKLVDGLTPLPYPIHTDNDIVTPTVEANGEQAVYNHYAEAQAGDIAVSFRSDSINSVHTRLVKEVHVVRDTIGDIDPARSTIIFTEQAGPNTDEYTDESGNSYYSSSRTANEVQFSTLLDEAYVIYTLDEYETDQVENVRIQAVAGSKTANTSFADGGVNIAVSSNYRIISHRVTLEKANSEDDPVFDSGLQYNISAFPVGFNYQNTDLDNVLRGLPSGEYTLTVSVDSGPFTSLEQTKVQTTDKTFEFTVDRKNMCDADNDGVKHEGDLGWTKLDEDWFDGGHRFGAAYRLTSGKYYLTNDLTVPNAAYLDIAPGAYVILCLNGYDLKLLPGYGYSDSIMVHNDAYLTLCDCAGTGTIQAGDETTSSGSENSGVHALYLRSGCQVDMYGGTITNTYASSGSVYVYAATLNMYGGAISDNTAPKNYSGVCVTNGGEFNMHSGTISNNSGLINASGINLRGSSTANIYGGTISGCTGPYAVYITGNSTLNMSDGEITNNTCDYDAVYVDEGQFNMTGGSIYGNTVSPGKKQVDFTAGTGVFNQTGGTVIENLTYSVTVTPPVNGTVSVDPTSGTAGTTVTVTATPDEGYFLEKILVDDVAIEGNTFSITDNHTVTATFSPQHSFCGTNVDLGNTLDLNFYYHKDYAPEDGYAKIERTYANGRKHVQTLPKSNWQFNIDPENPDDPVFYQFTYSGLAAKEMCDQVSVTIYDTNDTQISETKTHSIRSYAMEVLDLEEWKSAYTTLVDMLNYGAAAQEYFKYGTDDLANSELTEAQKALATRDVEYTDLYEKPDNYYGTNLDLESRIRLNFYFTGVTDGMTAEVSYIDHLGNEVTVAPAELKKNTSTHQVSVENLAVADGDIAITCTVKDANGNVHARVTDSINSYVLRAKESYSWLEYIAKFSTSAYNYLHTKTN